MWIKNLDESCMDFWAHQTQVGTVHIELIHMKHQVPYRYIIKIKINYLHLRSRSVYLAVWEKQNCVVQYSAKHR